MRYLIFAFMFLLLAFPAIAGEPLHTTLLAAHEENNGTLSGSAADVYLEVRPGTGRVFLETFPLTKVDTQISTRFAKEIACNYFDLECDNLDFIYTIKSNAPIIGGPSAGAALAALTTAAVLELPVNQSVAITGTINSGGLVGPVGGLLAKADAARQAGIQTVLIPLGTLSGDGDNSSSEAIEYGKNYSINVVEANNLGEVLFYFTGKKLIDEKAEVIVDNNYVDIMRSISTQLCSRADDLSNQLSSYKINDSDKEDITNRTASATAASEAGAYYSAASYCFGLDVKLRGLLYEKQKQTESKIKSKAGQLKNDIIRFENGTNARELHTITDLQTSIIATERLAEAKRYLEQVDKSDISQSEKSVALAYAEERFFSAKVWSNFFGMPGSSYVLNKDILKKSCVEKIQEAQERIQYLSIFLPDGVPSIDENVDSAEEHEKSGEYGLCLIQSSQAKAEANAILGTIGVDESQIGELLDIKFAALEQLISRTVKKGTFPILGYSYYEYANSLRAEDESSALLYSEYALEMSNLDIYFKEENGNNSSLINLSTQTKTILVGIAGFVLGAVFVAVLKRSNKSGSVKHSKSGKKRR